MRVLIVGAGIAGLAVGRALQRQGITAEIVERQTQWEVGGTGLYLPGNCLRAIEALGLGAEVRARAAPIVRQRILDHRGRLLAEVDAGRYWMGVGGCVAIPRAALHEVLRAGAADAQVRLGIEATELHDDGTAAVVRFSDGSSGIYDLVVGADGIHSTIRDMALGGPPARYVGQASWRFVAEGFPDLSDWTVMLGRGRAFLSVALGQGAVYCYADLDTNDPAAARSSTWGALFDDFADPAPRLLDHAADAYFAPIEEVAPPAWTAGLVALVGDAAHASSPNMAQGAAMAIEDGLVLADVLASGRPLEDALPEYERRRTSRVTWVQQQTHRRDRTRGLPPIVRNLILRLAGERIYRSNYRPLLDPP